MTGIDPPSDSRPMSYLRHLAALVAVIDAAAADGVGVRVIWSTVHRRPASIAVWQLDGAGGTTITTRDR